MTVIMRKIGPHSLFIHLDNGDIVEVPNNQKWTLQNWVSVNHQGIIASYLIEFQKDVDYSLPGNFVFLLFIHGNVPLGIYNNFSWLNVVGGVNYFSPWNYIGMEFYYGSCFKFVSVVGASIEFLVTEEEITPEERQTTMPEPTTFKQSKGGWNF